MGAAARATTGDTPFTLRTREPSPADHITKDPSPHPVAISAPSAVHTTERTSATPNASLSTPATDHMRTVVASQVTTSAPSGENATAITAALCPENFITRIPDTASNRLASSTDATASCVPSGEYAWALGVVALRVCSVVHVSVETTTTSAPETTASCPPMGENSTASTSEGKASVVTAVPSSVRNTATSFVTPPPATHTPSCEKLTPYCVPVNES